MAAPDAMCLDEDGHALPVMVWINKLTMGAAPKQMMIAQTHGQLFDYIGWVSFNYTLAETYQDAEGNREHCTEDHGTLDIPTFDILRYRQLPNRVPHAPAREEHPEQTRNHP
jgi:hypothetical protein